MMGSVSGESINKTMAIIMCGITKVFVGELVSGLFGTWPKLNCLSIFSITFGLFAEGGGSKRVYGSTRGNRSDSTSPYPRSIQKTRTKRCERKIRTLKKER